MYSIQNYGSECTIQLSNNDKQIESIDKQNNTKKNKQNKQCYEESNKQQLKDIIEKCYF